MLEEALNPTFKPGERLRKRVTELLLPDHQLALNWILQYEQVCHLLDDVIDEKITDPEVHLKLHQMTITLYTHEFFRQYYYDLYPVVCLCINTYADSVHMERSTDTWKQQMFDGIRNVSNEIVSHIIGFLYGWEAKREISMLLREDSYFHHHDAAGKPI